MYVSVIIGILLGIIIYYSFLFNNMSHGPDSNIIRNQVYYQDGIKYKLEPIIFICPNYG